MRNNIKTYTIDFRKVKYYSEIHEVIQKSLNFPDYYGCNWSAFWDCLTELYGEPMRIEIIGMDIIKQNFGDAASKMTDILKRFRNYEPLFTKDIEIVIISRNNRIQIR